MTPHGTAPTPSPTGSTQGRLRALFLNQGALGNGVVLGPTAVANALAAGLRGTGIDATFQTLPRPNAAERLLGHRVPGLAWADVDLHVARWVLAESTRGRRGLRLASRQGPFDALHLTSHTPALLLGRRRPARTFVFLDATIDQWESMGALHPERRWSPLARRLVTGLERRALEQVTVIAFTQWAADGVREVAPGSDVHVIHAGIDIERFSPAAGARRPGPFRVLMVASRFAEKGGNDLLAALSGRLGRDVALDVVTPGRLAPRPGLRVHRLDSGSPELVELYRAADVVCLPTYADACPWVLLESLACGTPVISTTVGAIPELVGRDGERGRLVGSGDVAGLRWALDDVLADLDAAGATGRRGREFVAANYDSRLQGQRLAELMRR